MHTDNPVMPSLNSSSAIPLLYKVSVLESHALFIANCVLSFEANHKDELSSGNSFPGH